MKALTICQPYAHLIAIGVKRVENRRWKTSYRGPLAIHAGLSRLWLSPGDEETYPGMAFGAIVATAELVACYPLALLPPITHARFGWVRGHAHTEGPICHILEDVRALPEPIPCKGGRGGWPVPHAITTMIFAQRCREECRRSAGADPLLETQGR